MEIAAMFELSRWGDGKIHLYHEDHLHGDDIDIVLDATHPCANGERVDIVQFLRSIIIIAERSQGLRLTSD